MPRFKGRLARPAFSATAFYRDYKRRERGKSLRLGETCRPERGWNPISNILYRRFSEAGSSFRRGAVPFSAPADTREESFIP